MHGESVWIVVIQIGGSNSLLYCVLSESADEHDKIDATLSDLDTVQRRSKDEDYAEAQGQYVPVSHSHAFTS